LYLEDYHTDKLVGTRAFGSMRYTIVGWKRS
jgi:hypothetical protein